MELNYHQHPRFAEWVVHHAPLFPPSCSLQDGADALIPPT
jgi:hypothetical protein